MGFARNVADRVIFMDAGEIVEVAPPEQFFTAPQNERTRQFLGQILHAKGTIAGCSLKLLPSGVGEPELGFVPGHLP